MKYSELIKKMLPYEKVSLLSGRDFWKTKEVKRLKIPSMFLADGPHGLRKQAGNTDQLGLNDAIPATCFPTGSAIANSWDIDLCEKIGEFLAEEAISQKVNVILGPGMNIKRSPLCGRNFEYFSEDPYLSGKLAAAYIRGIQSMGIAACPKHFAVNNQELQRMTNDSIVDERALHEIYLTGFEIAVKEGNPKVLMSSYNRVNGTYTNENKLLLRDILVDQWGFKGIVVSDWGGSNSHVEGVKSGSHLEMPSTGGESDQELLEAIMSGEIGLSIIDERVNEYLKVLFEIQTHHDVKIDKKSHHNMARKAAEHSIVLLKNEENILPLKAGAKVAVIGEFAKNPRYQGAGSSLVNPSIIENPLDELKKTDLEIIGYKSGFHRNGKKSKAKLKSACTLAEKAELVLIYVGLDEISEAEGFDRFTLKINQNQIDLIEAVSKKNQNIVVVLSCGAPVELGWAGYCKALLYGGLSGQAGASAMAHVIRGEVCPSGKLAETFPVRLSDTPNYSYYPGKERTSEYRESIYVGYRYYDTVKKEVMYPFGFGLSYTTFEYSDILVSDNHVSFVLTNTGNVACCEIAQVYISKASEYVFRPEKELKGFKKVFLLPGESQNVAINWDDYSFRYYNIKTNKFEVESGDYTILVGASSRDIRLKGHTSIKGTQTKGPYNRANVVKYFKGDVQTLTSDDFSDLLGKPCPESKWDKLAPLTANDSISQLFYAKSKLARALYKLLSHIIERSHRKGKPNINVLFVYYMPFRGIAKLTGGSVNMPMVEGILTLINGQFFKGLKQIISEKSKIKRKRK